MSVPLLRLNYQWDADVAFMPFVNDGSKGFLLCVDIFSRQAHTCAINITSAEQAIKCFNNIFETTKLSSLRTDGGMEFRAKKVRAFFKDRSVNHYITQSTHQANYAESCIKTINSKLTNYMLYKNTEQWVLSDTAHSYNHKKHSALGRTPASVNDNNQEEALIQQYLIKSPNTHKKSPFKYDLGDEVRISYRSRAFPRAYDAKWSG